MADRENRCRRSVGFIVTCLLHGGILFVLIHIKTEDKSRKSADQPLTIFLVRPQPAVAIALLKQSPLERQLRQRQEQLPDSETPLRGVSIPPIDGETSEIPAPIDWAGEARQSADAIAGRSAPANSASSAAGSAPWDPHSRRFESTPDGLKLRVIDPCFALLHNWSHDPLLGTKGELQFNCNWKKPPPRGDLFDSIRR